jgi:hypothetical protein
MNWNFAFFLRKVDPFFKYLWNLRPIIAGRVLRLPELLIMAKSLYPPGVIMKIHPVYN